MIWWVPALLAAIVWGIHYPLIGRALEHISPYSVALLTVLPIALLYPFFYNQVSTDVTTFRGLELTTQISISLLTVTSISGTLLLYLSIGDSNATLASLIEMSYPIFVALFSYFLFKGHINSYVIIGGLLILTGVAIVILGNK